jgi:hypothetical protein
MYKITIFLFLLFYSHTAFSEDKLCKEFRVILQRSHDELKKSGSILSEIDSLPGIGAAIKRQKIAKNGLPYAYDADKSTKYLLENYCLDFMGQKTDWTKIRLESQKILENYKIQSMGP